MTRNQTVASGCLFGLALLLGGILIGDEPAETALRSGTLPAYEQAQPTSRPTASKIRSSLTRLPPVSRATQEVSVSASSPSSPASPDQALLDRPSPFPIAAPVHWLDGPAGNSQGSRTGDVQREPAKLPSPFDDRTRFAPPISAGTEGNLVTMHLNEVSVRQALETLSRSHGLNILVAPGVAGMVTANIESMEVGQALDAILKLSGHVAQREGELIYVYAETELPRSDFHVRVFPLDFVGAIDVLPIVSNLLSTSGLASASSMDPTDSTKAREAVVVTDRPVVLQRVAEFIEQIDVPPMQVMIEAHVLQVDLTDDLRHGINYKQAMDAVGSGIELEISDFADDMASPAVFARIAGSKVDGLLQFLKTNTEAKTLASPRLMVINGQKARIQVGERLPYKVRTVTETAMVEEVQYLEVGVVLEVTARISRDGRVMMRVKPEVSDGLFTDTDLPGEETRELESDVLLEDGQGVVIGGLIQEKDIEIQTKVPYLGDLHWVGRLFQRRSVVKERTEIVITLVPRICRHASGVTERDIIDAERSQTPLFHGPLHRNARPWEPTLPDAIRNPEYLWGLGLCRRCGREVCVCAPDAGYYNGSYSPSSVAPAPEPASERAPEPLAPPPVVTDQTTLYRNGNDRRFEGQWQGWPPVQTTPDFLGPDSAGARLTSHEFQFNRPAMPAVGHQPAGLPTSDHLRPYEPPAAFVPRFGDALPLPNFGEPVFHPSRANDGGFDTSYLPLPRPGQ